MSDSEKAVTVSHRPLIGTRLFMATLMVTFTHDRAGMSSMVGVPPLKTQRTPIVEPVR
jgi:hypothetical protein